MKIAKWTIVAGVSGVGTAALGIAWLLYPSAGCACVSESQANSMEFLSKQVDYLRKNGEFAGDLDRLGITMFKGKQQAQTHKYLYNLIVVDRKRVALTLTPKQSGERAVVVYGVVKDFGEIGKQQKVLAAICESERANAPIPGDFRFAGTSRGCPSGYTHEGGGKFEF